MKKLLTIVACLILSQLVKADALALRHGTDTNLLVHNDTVFAPKIAPVASLYENNIFKRRLDSIQKEVPLNYNDLVQNYINLYTAPNRRSEVANIIGLSKYYFPIYEKAFRDAGIPEEIKFLSIVESSLNPNAVSRVGAAGPWQFMFTTGKIYGLNINNYVDERCDPIQSTYAAAAYLKDAYQEFGDWLLAIASYNCGKSNVEHAIEKAGALDYWSIRQYLPVETQGYVPAYIAVSYVMNYFNKHNISPRACTMSLKTDTILVNKYVSLSNVAKVLGINVNELALLNPAYKKRVINGTSAAPRRLVVPQTTQEQYTGLYNALNSDALTVPSEPTYAITEVSQPIIQHPVYHVVRRGETLVAIADRFGVEVEDLKLWNHLHSSKATPGQRLKVSSGEIETTASPQKDKNISQS